MPTSWACAPEQPAYVANNLKIPSILSAVKPCYVEVVRLDVINGHIWALVRRHGLRDHLYEKD